jgi:proline iminopeptidase
MTEAKLAPNLPDWMVEHANRYLSSGGADGHMYKMTQPGRPEITVPALLLTTTGRKSGERFIFPLFYGKTGDSYLVVASKGGAPQHPGWYRNILANPEVDVQVGTAKMKARARTATGAERARLWERRSSSGRPTPTTSARPSARSRLSCSTPSADRNCAVQAPQRHERARGPRRW